MPRIRTPKQVCQSFGADYYPDLDRTNKSLSRRVYKGTDCGAWAKMEYATVGTKRDVEWSATLSYSLAGIKVINNRK
jgi:hypothetical protein